MKGETEIPVMYGAFRASFIYSGIPIYGDASRKWINEEIPVTQGKNMVFRIAAEVPNDANFHSLFLKSKYVEFPLTADKLKDKYIVACRYSIYFCHSLRLVPILLFVLLYRRYIHMYF